MSITFNEWMEAVAIVATDPVNANSKKAILVSAKFEQSMIELGLIFEVPDWHPIQPPAITQEEKSQTLITCPNPDCDKVFEPDECSDTTIYDGFTIWCPECDCEMELKVISSVSYEVASHEYESVSS